MAMTSRERVVAALNHKEPDRVPVDLGSTLVSTLTGAAYQNLRAYLQMPDHQATVSNRNLGSVYPGEDLIETYGVDTHAVHGAPVGFFDAVVAPDGDSYADEYDITWRRASYYFDIIKRPLADADASRLRQVRWADSRNPLRVRGLKEQAKRLYEDTDYCLVLDIMCNGPFEQACKLRGLDQFLVDLYVDKNFAIALLEKITETDIELWNLYLDEVGEYVQVVAQGDDLGMQTSLFISPEMYREFIKPLHRRIFDTIHARTDAKVFLHSCGSVYSIIADLVDVGVDILNPVQVGAANMELEKLKREFGGDIAFWGGGIDTQLVLPQIEVSAIRAEVQRAVETMAKDGGYVFAPTHNIQPDIPPEKIDAVYRSMMSGPMSHHSR